MNIVKLFVILSDYILPWLELMALCAIARNIKKK